MMIINNSVLSGVPAVLLILIMLTTGCGGSDSDTTGNTSTLTENSGQDLSGLIIFDQTSYLALIERLGVSAFSLSSGQLTLLGDGSRPRQQHGSDKTVYLQPCADDTFEPYYRVVLLDSRGLISPVSPCSRDIYNPTWDEFFTDHTKFGFSTLSHDETMVAVTASYRPGTGEKFSTIVFDLGGNQITEIPDSYDATWLRDGRLLYAFGHRFFITDENLANPVPIDDGGLINGPVNNPAVHPDGEFLAFEFNNQIWQMNLDGSGVRIAIEGNGRLRHPAWSPDGNKLVFTLWNGGNTQKSLYFWDSNSLETSRVDIGAQLQVSGEPWPPLSWVEE